jgi:hypothetical protein
MSAALVSLRLHRWSLGAMAALCVLLTALAGWLAWDISNAVAGCQIDLAAARCTELATSGTFKSQDVVKVVGLLGFVPFIGGALVGGPLVAREVEQRTASLAWPLAIWRWRWLLTIAAPVIGVGALLTALPAAAGYLLVGAYAPAMNPSHTFEHFGLYGPALVVRYVAVATVALFAGIWLGRTLPALIASAIGALILYLILSATTTMWLAPVQLPTPDAPGEGLGNLFVRQMARLPSGELVPIEEAEAIDPELDDVTETVDYGLTADRAPEIAWREGGVLVAGSAVGMVAATASLRRRRPY